MIRELHPDDAPLVDPAERDWPSVDQYLGAVESLAPGLDLTWDRAVVIGRQILDALRAGELQRYRAIALLTFDNDEFDTLIAAAMAFLDADPDTAAELLRRELQPLVSSPRPSKEHSRA